MADWKKKENEKVEAAAEAMSRFVNQMSHEPGDFVKRFTKEHRTLQQSFTAVCFAWIAHLANLEEGQYDMRNEASVKAAKKIMEKFDQYDLALPFI